jgi:hypothetical protein
VAPAFEAGGGGRLLGRRAARAPAAAGDRVKAYFDMRQAQFFDAESGANLALAAAAEGN